METTLILTRMFASPGRERPELLRKSARGSTRSRKESLSRRASSDYRRRNRLTTPLRLKTMVEAGRIEFPAGPIGVLHEFVH